MKDETKRWRLILGDSINEIYEHFGEPLTCADYNLDKILSAIYHKDCNMNVSGGASGVVEWLREIKKIFDKDSVNLLQLDALEKKDFGVFLKEPEVIEAVKPFEGIAAAVAGHIPNMSDNVTQPAIELLNQIYDNSCRFLERDIREVVFKALSLDGSLFSSADGKGVRNDKSGKPAKENGKLKSNANLSLRTFLKRYATCGYTFITGIDPCYKGSLSTIFYGAALGAALRSMSPSCSFIACLDDAGTELAVKYGEEPALIYTGMLQEMKEYAEQYPSLNAVKGINDPENTLLVIISDLYGWGRLVCDIAELADRGVKVIVITSVSNDGFSRHDEKNSMILERFNIPCAACTPELLHTVIERAIKAD